MDGFLWWCGLGLEHSTYVPPPSGVSAGGLGTQKKLSVLGFAAWHVPYTRSVGGPGLAFPIKGGLLLPLELPPKLSPDQAMEAGWKGSLQPVDAA